MKTQLALSLESQIKDIICTSRPYFALDNLQALTDTLFQCEIRVQNIHFGEQSPISPAETGRHLAILGSCVLAYNNPVPTKHYYLACEAWLERGADCPSLAARHMPAGTTLICRAQLEHLDAKKGTVSTSIATQDGETIFELTVSYKVMKAELFEKLFKSKYHEAKTTATTNPYTKPMELGNLQITAAGITAEMGIIRPEQCVGHFDHYPALPVAILSSALVELAGTHLKQVCNSNSLIYATQCTQLNAACLAFAGDEVFLQSTLLGSNGNEYSFRVTAVNGAGTAIGSIETTFAVIGDACFTAETEAAVALN